MRPKYETDDDRKNQEEVVATVGDAWGIKFDMTPTYYPFDALAHYLRGDESHYVALEVKCRTKPRKDYNRLLLSAAKVAAVEGWISAFMDRTRAYLVYRFADGEIATLRWHQINRTALVMGGRRDRGDVNDIEPCVVIDPATLMPLRKRSES